MIAPDAKPKSCGDVTQSRSLSRHRREGRVVFGKRSGLLVVGPGDLMPGLYCSPNPLINKEHCRGLI